jgi:hypothetical protein
MTTAARSILASINESDHSARVDTILVRFPRIILAEVLTHRVFSRNTSSSRAIPTARMIASIVEDPFIPDHWGMNRAGMQADVEAAPWRAFLGDLVWRSGMWFAVQHARALAALGFHKQLANRMIDPYSHVTMLISSTEWKNFLELRDHEAAEPHMHDLARCISDALATAQPQLLKEGEWHLPFVTPDDFRRVTNTIEYDDGEEYRRGISGISVLDWYGGTKSLIRLSVARCASTSYDTVDGYEMTQERADAIYAKLVGSRPMHASPTEHVCRVDLRDDDGAWRRPELHGNFTGFIQHRKLLEL